MTKNEEKFAKIYRKCLRKAVQEKPQVYFFGVEQVDEVADRMIEAVKRRTFNKDGFAFKWACKELGIPHTYKAICQFLVQ